MNYRIFSTADTVLPTNIMWGIFSLFDRQVPARLSVSVAS